MITAVSSRNPRYVVDCCCGSIPWPKDAHCSSAFRAMGSCGGISRSRLSSPGTKHSAWTDRCSSAARAHARFAGPGYKRRCSADSPEAEIMTVQFGMSTSVQRADHKRETADVILMARGFCATLLAIEQPMSLKIISWPSNIESCPERRTPRVRKPKIKRCFGNNTRPGRWIHLLKILSLG